MGKLEKVVVLLVLGLVAVILGVSLNAPAGVGAAEGSDPTLAQVDPDGGSGPRAPVQRAARPEETRSGETRSGRTAPVTRPPPAPGTEVAAAAERGARGPGAGTAAAGTQPIGPAGVLSTSKPEPAASEPARPEAVRPAGGDGNGYLLTQAGLAPSLSGEFMIYTWQAGDTFAAVAERYFGSPLHVNRLLRNNEGLEDRRLQAGDRILVPVGGQEEPVASAWTGAATYKVQSGDVLGTISSTVYGTSKNWRKIYDANRDVLADPNRLEVGMVLRIPE